MSPLRDQRGLTEAEAIARFREANYPKPSLTADIALFARHGAGWRLLMIRRGGHPCLGQWALPGGFADQGETIERTAARELEEETGIRGVPMALVGVYSEPGRDPRGWTVSVAYAAKLEGELSAVASDDAAQAGWFDIRFESGQAEPALPEGGTIAFDHARIIADAAKALGL